MNNQLKYTCLFGGGAIRGLAYVGAIRALEELGIEYDIVGGSSVGSIFAALVACGYKSYELENLFIKVNFELFKDIHLGLAKNFALSKGGIFVDWLNELISRKAENIKKKNLNFEDLQKELVIITTNLKTFSTQEFSKNQTPEFEIAKAIRISSSMPGLMPPYDYNGASLVDGDLQKASPMWKLSDTVNNSESRILEFRLEGSYGEEKNTPISYLNTIYSCITDVATGFVTEIYGQNDRYDCIRINTGDIFFADLNLDKESRRKLINAGYEQTMQYFKEILPAKKDRLEKVYSTALKFLKNANKGLNSNNVEETQWWFGDLFMLLCENKEIVDPVIYKEIFELKELIMNSVSTILFFHTRFKNTKQISEAFKHVINQLDQRISELKLFLQSNK